jgi:hypothetical protein
MMILLSQSFLCPGTEESGPHVTDNANCCPCGNSNLASLARILDRTDCAERYTETIGTVETVGAYDGICCDQMPLIDRILWREN